MQLNNPIFINQTDADIRYINATGDALNGTLSVTGLTVSGLGTSFILKNVGNSNAVYFDPTTNGNAGALFSNWLYSSNMGSRGDDNFDFYYGGAGARSVRFLGYNGSVQPTRAILDSNGNFGIGSGISSVPSRFYVSGNTILQGDLNVTGNIFLSDNPVLTGSNHTHLWSQSIYDSQLGGAAAGFAGRTAGGNLTLHAGTQSTAVPSFYGWDGFQNTSFTAATARTNLELTSTATAVENTFVRTTGDQTISGIKSFATGTFQSVQINKNRFLSYDYETGNFNIIDYVTIVNCALTGSGDFATGVLPSGNISGFNFFVKNINACPVVITGSGNYTIDNTPNLYIYSGESVELLGVTATNLTGWYTMNTNLGAV